MTPHAVTLVIGLDPGLQRTGWGILAVDGVRLRHVAHGIVASAPADPLAVRLKQLFAGLSAVLDTHRPTEAAIEETFVNQNPASTLKLGQARGVVLLVPATQGLPVAEYAPNLVKKAVVGVGHADKSQVHAMVSRLLPGCGVKAGDAADALAVAIAHAHLRTAQQRAGALLTSR